MKITHLTSINENEKLCNKCGIIRKRKFNKNRNNEFTIWWTKCNCPPNSITKKNTENHKEKKSPRINWAVAKALQDEFNRINS